MMITYASSGGTRTDFPFGRSRWHLFLKGKKECCEFL